MGESLMQNAALIIGCLLATWVTANLVFSAYFFQKRLFLMKLSADVMSRMRGDNG